eukprot:933268-Heterocapsa_arctica.AAC.1
MSEVAQPEIMEEVAANAAKGEDEATREVIEQIVNNEAPFEPVKMKKPRAKAKAAAVAITKECIMETVKEATKKPVPDQIDKNKEMVTCPDCGLSITYHNLKYTHKRYCKALKEQQEESASVVVTPIPPPPPTGLLQREKDIDC